MMPHLPYVDAVHAALVAADLAPEVVAVGGEDDYCHTGRLAARYEWPAEGITLQWTGNFGWRHEADHSSDPLMVDGIADPAAIADGGTPRSDLRRWTGAPQLDRALSDLGQ